LATFYSNNQPQLIRKSFLFLFISSGILTLPSFRAPRSSHPAPLSRTTALNNIKAVKKVTSQSKPKQSGKAKPTRKIAEILDSGSNIGLSDEDDSQERKVALASPEKGAEARKSAKVNQSNPCIFWTDIHLIIRRESK
jgi:hypothetical protein